MTLIRLLELADGYKSINPDCEFSHNVDKQQ